MNPVTAGIIFRKPSPPVISIEGIRSERKAAVSMTPAANPIIRLFTEGENLFLNTYTPAAPIIVPTNGRSSPNIKPNIKNCTDFIE
jgi:hypothetical protein